MSPPKRIGRPPIAGRMVLVKLTDEHIATARALGGGGKGKMSAGVRRALETFTVADPIPLSKRDGTG